MKFIELYNRIIKFWPDKIEINDGYPIGENGFIFPTLSKVYDEIENKIDHTNDHWGNIGIWAFFQAFHSSAQKLIKKNKETLITRNVSKELIDKYIKMNLQSKDWELERLKYKGL